jgi:glycerophosphoryl diester phosphodiesterase
MPFIKIAHAGGEYHGKTYQNSIEAIEHNFKKGYRYFEIDLIYHRQNVLVAHDIKQIHENTPTFKQIVHHFDHQQEHPYFILDIKNNYTQAITLVSNIIRRYDHYIPQIYSLNDLNDIVAIGTFKKVVLANWKYTPTTEKIQTILDTANRHNIEIIGTSLWSKFSKHYDIKKYEFYNKLKIPIFAHGNMTNKNQLLWARNNTQGVYNLTKHTTFQ